MPAASIVFVDIVRFSTKSTAEQKWLVESLTCEVLHSLRSLLNPPHAFPNTIALPTGDGLALAFLHESNRSWEHATILNLILKLHQWAFAQALSAKSVQLRIGVHVGPVELITDINGKANICGDTINYAQRVMNAAEGCQTLYSEAAFREYIGTENCIYNSPPFSKDLSASFQGPIEVFAKHELQILVYKLTLEPPQDYWSNADPEAKHLMAVNLTTFPKEIVGDFCKQIQKARKIALIQLTGDRFIDNFNEGKIEFSTKLKRFWLFMPEPDTYSTLHLSKSQPTPQQIADYVQKWREFFAVLASKFPDIDLKLGLFKDSPCLAASFLDWDRPKGKIHVSPYVWDVPAPRCPGYDLQWLGATPSEIYETYVTGLDYLHRTTKNELAR